MMFTSFHSKGSIPSSKDKLNTIANGKLICSTLSSNSLGGFRFTTDDSLSFVSRIFYATIFGGTISCPKQTHSLRLTFSPVTGSELISSLANTELKYLFRFSSNKNTSIIMFPSIASRGSTLS